MDFLSKKRCLVTGDRGFIGTHLCAALHGYGAEVVGLDRQRWDEICAQTHLRLLFDQFKPDLVFHLAAQTEVLKSFTEPRETYTTNVLGTLNILEECRRQQVASLVVASSDKAYGHKPPEEIPYREEMTLASDGDIYASSKRAADDLCHDYGRVYKLPLRVLRCANTYGPGQRNRTTLITSATLLALRGEQPKVHAGFANVKREWLYVDDAVQAYLLASLDAASRRIEQPAARGAFAFNVGSGDVRTVLEIVRCILRQLGRSEEDYELVGTGVAPQIGDQCLDSSRFRHRFPAWLPIGLECGLAQTVDWYRKHAETR